MRYYGYFFLILMVLVFSSCEYFGTSIPDYFRSNYPHTYKIGDRGPAGGWIFYIDTANLYSWTYLECGPEDIGNVNWGADSRTVGTISAEIGTGKSNTDTIISELEAHHETGRAAQLCRDYRINGFSDWFLPSKDELNAMWEALQRDRNTGNFHSLSIFNDNYWSSSEVSSIYTWTQNFCSGLQAGGGGGKAAVCYVRPIRAFKANFEK